MKSGHAERRDDIGSICTVLHGMHAHVKIWVLLRFFEHACLFSRISSLVGCRVWLVTQQAGLL